MRRPLVILALLFLAGASSRPRAVSRTAADDPARWVERQAMAIDGDEALARVVPFVANATVVGLGDATHGTHEFYEIKQRLIPLLQRAGFRIIALEAPYSEFERVRTYTLTGAGDPAAAIQVPDSFFLDADEILQTIEWARSENARGASPPIEVVGVDCAHPHPAMADVLDYLQRVDPSGRDSAAAHYACLSRYAARPWDYARIAATEQEDCRADIAQVRPALEAHRADYAARSSGEEFERIDRAARVVEQGELSLATVERNRDACMAENLLWLHRLEPDAKIVVWGHNEHFGKIAYDLGGGTTPSSGTILSQSLGSSYAAIGTIALRGTFWAYQPEGDAFYIRELALPMAKPDDYATLFARSGRATFFLPFTPPMPPWFSTPHLMRIGATSSILELRENLSEKFDGIFYFQTSTPSSLRHFPVLY